MVGRNGSDKLAFACITVAVVVVIINMFLSNIFLTFVVWALLIYYMFRCFSTNVAARQAENEKFESFISRLRGGRGSGTGGARGRSTSSGRSGSQSQGRAASAGRAKKPAADTITFQCDQCGQKLSVPKGKGTLKITCPKCHHQQKINS